MHVRVPMCVRVQVVSVEAGSVESFFGKEAAGLLRQVVAGQAETHRQRATHMVAVRQVGGATAWRGLGGVWAGRMCPSGWLG